MNIYTQFSRDLNVTTMLSTFDEQLFVDNLQLKLISSANTSNSSVMQLDNCSFFSKTYNQAVCLCSEDDNIVEQIPFYLLRFFYKNQTSGDNYSISPYILEKAGITG